MKSILAILIFVVLSVTAVLSLTAHAAPKVSMCYQIDNIDMRQMCIAQNTENNSICYSIDDSVTRLLCLAQVKKDSTLLANNTYTVK